MSCTTIMNRKAKPLHLVAKTIEKEKITMTSTAIFFLGKFTYICDLIFTKKKYNTMRYNPNHAIFYTIGRYIRCFEDPSIYQYLLFSMLSSTLQFLKQ